MAIIVLGASYLPVKKLLNYSVSEVIEDLGLPALFSVILGVVAWLVGSAMPVGGDFVLLCVKAGAGAACYIALSALFKASVY